VTVPTMGLDDAEYRRRASAAGKASILLWLVGGLTYNTYHRHLISVSSFLLVRCAAGPVVPRRGVRFGAGVSGRERSQGGWSETAEHNGARRGQLLPRASVGVPARPLCLAWRRT